MKRPKGSLPAPEARQPGIVLNRQKLVLEVGALVEHKTGVHRVASIIDFHTVVGEDIESGRPSVLAISELSPLSDASDAVKKIAAQDIEAISEKERRLAHYRFGVIKPLLDEGAGRHRVEARAKECGLNAATVYRWLKRYRGTEEILSLIPLKRGAAAGAKKLPPAVENIVQEVLKDTYLTNQRHTDQHVAREVRRRCNVQGLMMPHQNTVFRRIAEVDEKSKLIGRGYRERANNKFNATPGTFPGADYPLAVVQIDHTPVDLILVDEKFRKPIGRPYLTLAIDVFSRMVTGYYLSFDAPSETSVAMCVTHSILPKNDWLLLHGVKAEWGACGFMNTIHTDNGAEFRSGTFKRACDHHKINLVFRPVKRPRYGGHIERLLGTFLEEIHVIPGTTFSNIKDRDGYDSEKNAVMTMAEFETWFVEQICNIYHRRTHKKIGMPPAKKWEIGIFGNGLLPGHGLPAMPAEKRALLLDFMPTFTRTIQNDGVSVDGLQYYADVLKTWIGSEEQDGSGKKRQFIFRRDPRDISKLWFYAPDDQLYYEIPFANQAQPSRSQWEHRQAQDTLRKEGKDATDENQIMWALTRQRQKIEDSKEKTKQARRASERSKHHAKMMTPANPLPPTKPPEPEAPFAGLVDGVVLAFDEE